MTDNASLDRWNQLIYDLQGTCNGLESFLERHDAEDLIDHAPFLHYLDNHIFLCDVCGWWCELSEAAEDSDTVVCTDCYDSDN